MTILKLISGISIYIFLVINFRSTIRKTDYFAVPNTDTVYYSTTAQLKSNYIPDSVFQMTKLKHIAIQGMDCDYGDRQHCWGIREIPVQIRNLKDLKTLSLTVNTIDTIPIGLEELIKLVSIDFSDNSGFENIDNIVKIKSLEYLYLYGCGLTKLPDNIGELVNLKELGLVGNSLSNAEQTRIKKALPDCRIRF